MHAAIARGRDRVDRRVPLPPGRRRLRPGARPRRHRARRGGRRGSHGRRPGRHHRARPGPSCWRAGQSRLLEQIAAGLDLGAVLERVVRFTEAHGSDLLAGVLVLDPEAADAPAGRRARACRPRCARRAGRGRRSSPAPGLSALAAIRRERVVVAGPGRRPRRRRWRGPLLEHGHPRRLVHAALRHRRRAARHARGPLPGAARAGAGDLRLVEVAEPPRRDRDRARPEPGGAGARHAAARAGARHTCRSASGCSTGTAASCSATPPAAPSGAARATPASRSYGEYRGWRADTGEPIAPEEWAAARAILQGRDLAQRGGADRDLRRRAEDHPQLRRAAPEPRRRRSSAPSCSTRTSPSSAPARRRSAGARSSSARRRRWRRWASSPAASPTTSTTCSPASSATATSCSQELRPGDPIRGDLEQIRHAGQRAAALTRQLLAFSRRQVLQPRVLSLNAVVTELDAMLRRLLGADVALETELDPGALVRAGRPRPARAGAGEPGRQRARRDARRRPGHRSPPPTSSSTPPTTPAATASGPAAYVTLSVSDTGVGMDVPTQARIFEPVLHHQGARARAPGSASRRCTGSWSRAAGTSRCESAPGQGATFTIYLPRHAGRRRRRAGPADRRSLPGGTETLLLVEDEAAVRASARRLLERHGYTVIEARHGADALRIVEEASGRSTWCSPTSSCRRWAGASWSSACARAIPD